MNRTETSNLWLFLELMARRRSLIVGLVLICTATAVIISFLLPKWYEAEAVLLPPKDLSFAGPGQGYLTDLASLTKGLDLPVMVTPSDVYARMLKSRSIANRVIDQFDLLTRFKDDNMTMAYETLMDRASFKVTGEGLLEITFLDKDPQLAADVTNAFVKELERVNEEIVTARIRQNRVFVEGRLESVKATVDSARHEFEAFQVTHKAIDFGEQTRLAIEQAIGLKVQLAELNIDVKLNESKLGSDNRKLLELKQHQSAIREQLKLLENSNADSSFFSLPISAMPSLRGQYEVLYSRVRVNESLYQILLKQYEQAKFQEQEYSSTISVLDWATPPEIKSRPKRLLIVAATFVLSLLLAIFLGATAEYMSRLKESSPENHRRMELFTAAYLGWLPGIKRSRRT